MGNETPVGRSEALDARSHDPFAWAPTFSLSNRLRRLAWSVSWTLLARWTPPPLHKWRTFLLRGFGARMHWTAKVYGSAQIWDPANLEMAPYSTLGPGVICYSMSKVRIGTRAVVSQRAHLCCGSHDISSRTFQLFSRPIDVRANAWVCAEAFVGPGVTVGEGAVLAARSVTFSSLEAWNVYRGNPAYAIRQRPQFDCDNDQDASK